MSPVVRPITLLLSAECFLLASSFGNAGGREAAGYGLIVAGKVTPVIDRRYPLRETADAMAYAEEGHARAKVVITFQ